jgi:hypothetical protein
MIKVKSRPWPDISEFYEDIASKKAGQWVLPMLRLVEKIQASDFANQLYGAQSMTDLLLSNVPDWEMGRDVLRIRLNHETGLLEFEYQETPSPVYKRWRKSVPPDQSFSALVRFLAMKKWFSLSERTLRDVFGAAREHL